LVVPSELKYTGSKERLATARRSRRARRTRQTRSTARSRRAWPAGFRSGYTDWPDSASAL